jgi:hypothetical protein
MNEQYELVGTVGQDAFDVYGNYIDANNKCISFKAQNPRKSTMLFKDLPLGTELFIKVKNVQTEI